MQKNTLVVDNNDVFIRLLTHILEKKGWSVKTAHNGLHALDILDTYLPEYLPEVIFIDLIMPNIDGESLCKILRRRDEFSQTTLVILSAIALEEDIDFPAFGANACIAKGPMSEMEKHIDIVIEHVRENKIDSLPQTVLGCEHIFSRTVTKELLEVKRNFEVMLNHIDNGFIELSKSQKITKCNNFAAVVLGKNTAELLGTDIIDHFHAEAGQCVQKSLHRFHVDQHSVEQEIPGLLSGRNIVFKFAEMPLNGSSSTFMFIRDITVEKEALNKLQRHMQHLEKTVEDRTKSYKTVNRRLQEEISDKNKINEELKYVTQQWSKTFDTIPDFVSVHDKDMKFVRINKALASFLEKNPDEVIGKHCYELMHGRNTPWPNCPHVTAVHKGATVTEEIDDPNIGVPLLVTCAPFLHDDGRLMGTVHIARDISQQKEAAKERETLIKELEKTLSQVKQLSGYLPICASCKKIRDDKGYWSQVEEYVATHSEAEFSHSICPGCARKLYPDLNFEE